MKPRILLALCFFLIAIPCGADTLYENGPVNGEVDAWDINFGYVVTDSMSINGGITGLTFWAWLIPGDTISSVQVSIGSAPYGSDMFNNSVSLRQSNCFENSYGYNLCEETGAFNLSWLTGNLWLTLQNANVPSGDPVYWDENSGVGCWSHGCPSQAQENVLGTIPSEAFTINGTSTSCMCGCSLSPDCGETPEPNGLLLLLSGFIGVAPRLLRGKLHLGR